MYSCATKYMMQLSTINFFHKISHFSEEFSLYISFSLPPQYIYLNKICLVKHIRYHLFYLNYVVDLKRMLRIHNIVKKVCLLKFSSRLKTHHLLR